MQLRVVVRLLVVEALRALARNALRSGLAMLEIAVGVAIVITVIALGRANVEASEAELDKRCFGPGTEFVPFGNLEFLRMPWHRATPEVEFTQD